MRSGVGKYLALEENERWFLVHTLAKSELQAQFHLSAQGFRTHLPQYVKTVRHARQLRTVRAPLFPGYLFIILNPERDRWLAVRSTIGVSSLFTANGFPVPVPPGVVESLIARTDDSDVTRLDLELVEGQSVRILSGPLADMVGSLERLDTAGRVRVLLDIMGSSVRVTVRRSALAPAA